jgi:hypothetical protein
VRRAWPLGLLLVLPALAGCTDGLADLQAPVPAPTLPLGAWWTVHETRATGDGAPYLDERTTYWTVGTREVNGTAWTLALAFAGAQAPPRLDGTFRLLLLPPGGPHSPWGVQSEPWFSQQAPECRGVDACATADLLPYPASQAKGLPFPLGADYERHLGSSGGARSDTTGKVEGHAIQEFPFGRADAVRVAEHTRNSGFEYGGTSDTTIEYAPALGLVVREREDECSMPILGFCAGTSHRALDVEAHGSSPPPSPAEVGRAFAVAQASLVRVREFKVNASRPNVAAGDEVAARVAFTGLRANDTVEMRWLRANEAVASFPGNASALRPTRVGWHIIEGIVKAPQGVVVVTERASFHATYDGRVAVHCPMACPEVAVPVGPGIRTLRATVEDAGPLGGKVQLVDAAGEVRSSSCPGCRSAAIVLDTDEPGDWSARWVPDVGTPDDLTFHLEAS